MGKNNISRLLHTLVPFMVMTMVQRLLLLVFGHVGIVGELAELLAFLPAAVAAVLLFRVKTYHIYDEDEQTDVQPLQCKGKTACFLQTLTTVSVMIVMMYAVAAAMGGTSNTSDTAYVSEISVLSFVSLIIVHPLIEEYLFRRLFYGELRLMNPIFGCLMQAVMFAIIHNTVDTMIYALAGGVALAVAYERSGNIWTAVAAHIAVNLRSYLFTSLLAGRQETCNVIDAVLIILGIVAFFASSVIRGRRIASYNEENADPADIDGVNDDD